MDINEAAELLKSGERIHAKSARYKELMLLSQHMPSSYFPKQRLWHLVHGEVPPVCKTCGGAVKWDDAQPTSRQAYREFCSVACSRLHPDSKAKKLNTELQRYGKGRKEIVDKIQATNMQRYGQTHAIKLDEFKNKQSATNQLRYGVDNVMNAPDFKNKRATTFNDRYGMRHHAQMHLPKSVLDCINDKQWLYEQHITNKLSISAISHILGVYPDVVMRALKTYSIDITYYPSASFCEDSVADFIRTMVSGTILRSDKLIIPPQQLDIVVPDKKLAVEVNGLYWHSDAVRSDTRYHLSKTIACAKQGIQLFHIWEHEWYNKRHIVESMLRHAVGCTTSVVHARKCKLVSVSSKDARQFLNNNHLSGYVGSKINIGLEYNNELVFMMTLSKSRYSNHEYEMYRMCSKLNTSVVGGASKAFKHFIKLYNPASVVSYSDRRWASGNTYNKLGFSMSHHSAPNYQYFKNGSCELQSRVKFQKHKLEKLLPVFDASLTEVVNMRNNGYSRVWDCGNTVWVWSKPHL